MPAARLFSCVAFLALVASAASAEVYYRGSSHSFQERQEPARLSVSPSSLSGLDAVSGQAATTRTLTVSNDGGLPSGVPSLDLQGPFTIASSSCLAAIPAGGRCEITITAMPLANGPLQGSLVVSGIDLAVDLSGTASGYPCSVIGSVCADQSIYVGQHAGRSYRLMPHAQPAMVYNSALNGCPVGFRLPTQDEIISLEHGLKPLMARNPYYWTSTPRSSSRVVYNFDADGIYNTNVSSVPSYLNNFQCVRQMS